MSQKRAGSSRAVGVCLAFCIAGCSAPVLKPDSAQRPNQPMFIDPIADLKPQSGALADSWFVCSNLTSGDHEFGLLIHYLKDPFSGSPTVAITDVTDGKYILDESGSGKVTATPDGFAVVGDNLRWSANESTMRIQASLRSGDSFDLTTRRVGPVLPYNGTGYFPLFDSDSPTWEYAFPVMETSGTVTIGEKTYSVSGNSWFDRQWFASMKASLRDGQAYWTWISLKLSNGEIVTVWDAVGKRERAWATILHPDGTVVIADVEPLTKHMSGIWTSSKSGVRWPSKWTVVIPGTQARLTVTSTAEGQETFKGMPRIETVVHVEGAYGAKDVNGLGYVEIVNVPKLDQ